MLPIAQAMSAVGKDVKSATEQTFGVAEDILDVRVWGESVCRYIGCEDGESAP
jgi:hypothetical protein